MRFRRFFVLTLAILTWSVAWAATTVYIGPNATEIEQHAASEVQRYIYMATKDLPPIKAVDSLTNEDRGVVLGTPESLPKLPAEWPFGLPVPGADGYVLHSERDDNRLLIVAAPTPVGVRNGAYAALEEFGFGFYLGDETYREEIPDLSRFDTPSLHVSKTPAFEVRGTVPWMNFFNSASSWEIEDYKNYIDRLVRMRLNMVCFHSYDQDPFTACELDGESIAGAPPVNTSVENWGTQPLATENFFAGTGQYFADAYFGSKASLLPGRNESIAQAKAVLREAIEYAKGRGLKVGIGFDVRGDALDPQVRQRFETRLRGVLADYPAIDHLWIWEPEAMALHPGEDPQARSSWSSHANRWDKAFEDIAEPRRRAEAVRMCLFAQHGRQILAAVRPDIDLVVSGWGGDSWLHYTDFLPGMDKVLPTDVAFAALDDMRVSPTVSKAYGSLSQERRQWPILWLEYDGDQWMPQPNLYETAAACRDALNKQCDGLLGVHWRTRAVEESATYCARFAWDTELTVEAFCERRARDMFGDKLGGTLAPYLLRLQGLGYRWVDGAGQNESARFRWSKGDEEQRAELAQMAIELRQALGEEEKGLLMELVPGVAKDLVTDVVPGMVPTVAKDMAKEIVPSIVPEITLGLRDAVKEILGAGPVRSDRYARLRDLADELTYVLALDHAAAILEPDGALDTLVEQGDKQGAIDLIHKSKLALAMHAYAGRMSNKGELGVLATMNAKAWADLRARLDLTEEELDSLERVPEGFVITPKLMVLPDRVVVVGLENERLHVRVKARPLGSAKWHKQQLANIGGQTFALSFPDEIAETANYEWGVEVLTGLRTRLTWPAGFPMSGETATRVAPSLPTTPVPTETQATEPANAQATIIPERYCVQLTWTPQPGDTYTVAREGKVLGAVSDGWFEDAAPVSGAIARYAITARNLLTGSEATRSISVNVPELPLPAAPADIRVATRAGHVVLGWESSAPQASEYRVTRYDERDEATGEWNVPADPGHYLQFSDKVGGAQVYSYDIAGLTPDGRMGPRSKRMGAIPSKTPLRPMLRLSFEDEAFLEGLAQVAENALALGGSGWAELPPQPEWNPENELSVTMWAKLDDLDGMPVLICKGAWQQSGYFLQIFREQIRFYIAGVGTLDAGWPEPGKWQHLAATYGFGEMRIYIDGRLVGSRRVAGRPRPSSNPLLVGRYGHSDDVYFVRGLMDEINIFDVALTDAEIVELLDSTKRE